jgi:ApaG protein
MVLPPEAEPMIEQTPHIQIRVATSYLPEQSKPEAGLYAFAYTITIANEGGQAARLLTRHWIITDANGQVQEVRGDGVVGQQPWLPPGGRFQYTSGTYLGTPVGSMEGSYGMETAQGDRFDASIPAFSLAIPRVLH